MKIVLVRLSVVALALTGFAAASVTSRVNEHPVQLKQTFNTNNQPQTGCGWNDPHYCGM